MIIKREKEDITSRIPKLWSKFLLLFGYKTKFNKFRYFLIIEADEKEVKYLSKEYTTYLTTNVLLCFIGDASFIYKETNKNDEILYILYSSRYPVKFEQDEETINNIYNSLQQESQKSKIRQRIINLSNPCSDVTKEKENKEELKKLLKL